MRLSRKRSTLSMKLLQWNWMWKPTIELPSRPSRICSRHGQMLNTSELGQGMCQKVMIDRLRQPPPDHARQQREVIVLDQHDRPLVAGLLDDDVGELLVHGLVGFPVRGPEQRPGEGDMAERPQAVIGEAEIVALLLLLAQPDPAQRVGGIARRHLHVVVLVDRHLVGRAAAMRDPGAGAGAGHRLQRRNQPARRHDQIDLAVLQIVDVGLAVGDDDDLRVGQFRLAECGAACPATTRRAGRRPFGCSSRTRAAAGAACRPAGRCSAYWRCAGASAGRHLPKHDCRKRDGQHGKQKAGEQAGRTFQPDRPAEKLGSKFVMMRWTVLAERHGFGARRSVAARCATGQSHAVESVT